MAKTSYHTLFCGEKNTPLKACYLHHLSTSTSLYMKTLLETVLFHFALKILSSALVFHVTLMRVVS